MKGSDVPRPLTIDWCCLMSSSNVAAALLKIKQGHEWQTQQGREGLETWVLELEGMFLGALN